MVNYLVDILIIGGIGFFAAWKINSFYRKEATFSAQLEKLEKEFTKNNQQKKRVFSAWDQVDSAVIIVNQNDVIEYVNPKVEALLGAPAKKLLHKSILHLKDDVNVAPLALLLLGDQKYSFKKDVVFHENLTLSTEVHRLSFGRSYLGRLVILEDVTRGKVFERAKMDFVALTVHQLNVPLSTTRLSLSMLLGGSLGKLTAEQRDVIEKTLQRNNMLIDLVADLLDIAKIQEHGNTHHWELADVPALIKKVADSDAVELKNKKIKFAIKNPDAPMPSLMLDRNKIFVAIKNLLDNAIKYTPEKGSIAIEYGIYEKQFIFKIVDSGIGIPQEEQERIFSRFFRASNAVSFEALGSGLGLFIVKNIIEAHRGKIWFTSEENKGTTFSFSIPTNLVE